MDLGLSGKNAIIGASSQGLGFACAVELIREGANVLICGRTESVLKEAHKELEAMNGGNVYSIAADLASRAGTQSVLDYAAQVFSHTDILITNTGGPPPGPFESHDLDAWEATYRLLLESAVAMMRGVVPSMKERKAGRIIAITSSAVKQPLNGLILSNAVRASVTGLCKSLSNELGGYGITVNTVMPGFTRTNRIKSLLISPEAEKHICAEIPLGRVGEPEEFAAMVTFLASERASFITGQSIAVDGGSIKSLL